MPTATPSTSCPHRARHASRILPDDASTGRRHGPGRVHPHNLFRRLTNVCEPIAGSGELALRKHGLHGDRLLNMAYAIANGYCRKTGAGLDTRIDDLAQYLALTATRQALMYDPARNPNSTFTSYLWDIMEQRCVDWYRRKGEGFADRRYYPTNPVSLVGDEVDLGYTTDGPDQAVPDDDTEPRTRWRYAAWLVQQKFAEWPVVHERRIVRWQRAADIADLPLDQFVVHAADVYAQVMEKRAA
jgi:DNA-directed RNA polymerase specialized sigma24 family protein